MESGEQALSERMHEYEAYPNVETNSTQMHRRFSRICVEKLTLKGGKPMSFDWGSFTGGVVGTLGAFGAVYYSMYLQKKKEKPLIIKERLQVIDAITSNLDRYWIELTVEDLVNYQEAFQITISITNSLREFLTKALDNEGQIVTYLLNTIDELDDLGNGYSKKERSKDNLWNFQTDLLHLVSTRRSGLKEMKEEIFSKYKA